MLIWITIRSALRALLANKLRSFLAMLGIIIGVGAVIAMLALGAGAQASITSRFQAMGTNLLFVRPSQRNVGGVRSGNYQTLKLGDAVAIAQLPGVYAVSPSVSGSVQAKYLNQNMNTSIIGVATPYFEIRNFEIDKGRTLSEGETEGLARVTVIGSKMADTLFGSESPIGKQVKFNNINFTVIGTLKSKGDQGWANPDEQALIPYSTAMKIMFGQDYLRELNISVSQTADISKISGQPEGTFRFGPPRGTGTVHEKEPPAGSVTALLRHRHRLTNLTMADDFTIQNQAELLANLNASIATFRVLLGGIACISLLVGGIGIMNIMLVTVTERTREIGIRKAIGAKNRDVMLQFLVESIVMSGMGGALGAAAGTGMAKGITMIPMFNTYTTIVQPIVVVVSITIAGAVGIFFGLYPAYRASKLDPIEALRYE